MALIETHELTKRFGERMVVEALTLEVEEGVVGSLAFVLEGPPREQSFCPR